MTSTLQHKGLCTEAYFNSQMGVCKKAHNELQSELGKLVWFYNAASFLLPSYLKIKREIKNPTLSNFRDLFCRYQKRGPSRS